MKPSSILNRDVERIVFGTCIEAASGTPEALARHIRAEMKKWGTLIRQAGIKAD
jgi:tripartite-type tricarboxylate transporter receptor subunit TctC